MVNVLSRVAVQSDMICGCCGHHEAPVIWADDNKGICYNCYAQQYDVCSHCGRLLSTLALRNDENDGRICADCVEIYEYEKELS